MAEVNPAAPSGAPTRESCLLPPDGWRCTRGAGHEGPCAAVPASAPLRIDHPKSWWLERVDREGDVPVGAGAPPLGEREEPLHQTFSPAHILSEFRAYQASGCADPTFRDCAPHYIESLLARLATAEADRGELGRTYAPWTPEQVALLNNYQIASGFHPFTCGSGKCAHVELVAHEDGWHCPSCDYTQNWAHNFMTRPWQDPRAALSAVPATTPEG